MKYICILFLFPTLVNAQLTNITAGQRIQTGTNLSNVVSDGGGSTVTVIFASGAGGTGGVCITGGTNSTGATFIVGGTGGYRSPLPQISDSKSNPYHKLTESANGGGSGSVLWWTNAPSVGASHTFSAGPGDVGSANYSSVGAVGVTGITQVGNQSGMLTNALISLGVVHLPACAPTGSASLMVACMGWAANVGGTVSIDSGFTIFYQGYTANNIGYVIAYKVKNSNSSSEAPTFTFSAGAVNVSPSARLACFNP
jgi:hypothetical protein